MYDIALSLGISNEAEFRQRIQQIARLSSSSAMGGNVAFRLDTRNFTPALGRIKGEVGEFEKSLGAANARVLAFGASAGAIFAVTKALKETVRVTIEVQQSLSEIAVVMGRSVSSMSGFSNELFNIAGSLGQTFSTAAKAAQEFARQGVGLETTLKRTKDALLLTRMSGLPVEASVKAITAAMNSFNNEAIDSTRLVNQMAAVDMRFAVSSADLAEALRRVGSTASDAGVSIEQLMALVTSAQTITSRGGANIGEALKAIFTREARPKVLEAIAGVGIGLKNLDGTAKPLLTVFEELANKFDTLTPAMKSNISELVGGMYRMNILKALFKDVGSDFSYYKRSLEVANSATSEATIRSEELNKTLSSKLNKTLQDLTKLGVQVGSLSIAPALEKIFNTVDSLGESGDGIGGKIANSILTGFGKAISGPGITALTLIVGNLAKRMSTYAADAFVEVAGFNQSRKSTLDLEKQIEFYLNNDVKLYNQLKLGQVSVNEAAAIFSKTLDAQATSMKAMKLNATQMASILSSAGYKMAPESDKGVNPGGIIIPKGGKKVPNLAMESGYNFSEAIRKEKLAGYTDSQVKIGYDSRIGPLVYNTTEGSASKAVDMHLRKGETVRDIKNLGKNSHVPSLADGGIGGSVGLGLLLMATQSSGKKYNEKQLTQLAEEQKLNQSNIDLVTQEIAAQRDITKNKKLLQSYSAKTIALSQKQNSLTEQQSRAEKRSRMALPVSFVAPIAGGMVESMMPNKLGKSVGAFSEALSSAAMVMFAFPGPLGIAASAATLGFSTASKVYGVLNNQTDKITAVLQEQQNQFEKTTSALNVFNQVFDKLATAYATQSTQSDVIVRLQEEYISALANVPDEYRALVASATSASNAQEAIKKALAKQETLINQSSIAESLSNSLDKSNRAFFDTSTFGEGEKRKERLKSLAERTVTGATDSRAFQKRFLESDISSAKGFEKFIKSAQSAGEISAVMAEQLVRFADEAQSLQGYWDTSAKDMQEVVKAMGDFVEMADETRKHLDRTKSLRESQARSELKFKQAAEDAQKSINDLGNSIFTLSSQALSIASLKGKLQTSKINNFGSGQLDFVESAISKLGEGISDKLKNNIDSSLSVSKVFVDFGAKVREANSSTINSLFDVVQENIQEVYNTSISQKNGANIDQSRAEQSSRMMQDLGQLRESISQSSPQESRNSLLAFATRNGDVLEGKLKDILTKSEKSISELTSTKATLHEDLKENLAKTIQNIQINDKIRIATERRGVLGGGAGLFNASTYKDSMLKFKQGVSLFAAQNEPNAKGLGAVNLLQGFKDLLGRNFSGPAADGLKQLAYQSRENDIAANIRGLQTYLTSKAATTPAGSLEKATLTQAFKQIQRQFTPQEIGNIARQQIDELVPMDQMPKDVAELVKYAGSIVSLLTKMSGKDVTETGGVGEMVKNFSPASIAQTIKARFEEMGEAQQKSKNLERALSISNKAYNLTSLESFNQKKGGSEALSKQAESLLSSGNLEGALKVIAENSKLKENQDQAKELLKQLRSMGGQDKITSILKNDTTANTRSANILNTLLTISKSGSSHSVHDHNVDNRLKEIKGVLEKDVSNNKNGTNGNSNREYRSNSGVLSTLGTAGQIAAGTGILGGGYALATKTKIGKQSIQGIVSKGQDVQVKWQEFSKKVNETISKFRPAKTEKLRTFDKVAQLNLPGPLNEFSQYSGMPEMEPSVEGKAPRKVVRETAARARDRRLSVVDKAIEETTKRFDKASSEAEANRMLRGAETLAKKRQTISEAPLLSNLQDAGDPLKKTPVTGIRFTDDQKTLMGANAYKKGSPRILRPNTTRQPPIPENLGKYNKKSNFSLLRGGAIPGNLVGLAAAIGTSNLLPGGKEETTKGQFTSYGTSLAAGAVGQTTATAVQAGLQAKKLKDMSKFGGLFKQGLSTTGRGSSRAIPVLGGLVGAGLTYGASKLAGESNEQAGFKAVGAGIGGLLPIPGLNIATSVLGEKAGDLAYNLKNNSRNQKSLDDYNKMAQGGGLSLKNLRAQFNKEFPSSIKPSDTVTIPDYEGGNLNGPTLPPPSPQGTKVFGGPDKQAGYPLVNKGGYTYAGQDIYSQRRQEYDTAQERVTMGGKTFFADRSSKAAYVRSLSPAAKDMYLGNTQQSDISRYNETLPPEARYDKERTLLNRQNIPQEAKADSLNEVLNNLTSVLKDTFGENLAKTMGESIKNALTNGQASGEIQVNLSKLEVDINGKVSIDGKELQGGELTELINVIVNNAIAKAFNKPEVRRPEPQKTK